MKKIFTLTLIAIIAFSLVLVSCNATPNEDKKEDETKTKTMTTTEVTQVTTEVTDDAKLIGTTLTKISAVDDKSAVDYTRNVQVKVEPTIGDSFSFVPAGEIGKKTTDALAEDEGASPSLQAFRYVTFSSSSSNKKLTDIDDYVLTLDSQSVQFVCADMDEVITREWFPKEDGTWNDFINSYVMSQITYLLSLYSEDGTLTLTGDALKAVVKFAQSYCPQFTYVADFGTESERGQIKVVFKLSADKDDNLSLDLISFEVSLGGDVMVSAKSTKLSLTLSSDFSLGLGVSYDGEGGFSASLVENSITGKVTVAMKDFCLEISGLGKNVYLNGSASYDFTEGDIQFNLDASLKKDKSEILGAAFEFSGNLQKAQSEEKGWENFMKKFSFTSFRINGESYEPLTVNLTLGTIIRKNVADYLEKIFTFESSTPSESAK